MCCLKESWSLLSLKGAIVGTTIRTVDKKSKRNISSVGEKIYMIGEPRTVGSKIWIWDSQDCNPTSNGPDWHLSHTPKHIFFTTIRVESRKTGWAGSTLFFKKNRVERALQNLAEPAQPVFFYTKMILKIVTKRQIDPPSIPFLFPPFFFFFFVWLAQPENLWKKRFFRLSV